MVIQHIIDIDFVARDNTPVVHLTQYDDGLPYLVVRTFQNGNPLVLSSNEVTASLRFMKPDGNFVLSPGTVSDTEVCFKIPSAMTVFQGKYPGKVELKDSIGQIICSATIIFDIDMNPVQKDVVESDSDYKDYIDQVLGNIPGFDGYSKEEADAKFAPIDDVQKLENRKLDKVTTSGVGRVYCVNPAGEQTMRTYSGYGYDPSTLLYRESNGDCCMQDPISEMSIANKRYVDSAVNAITPAKIGAVPANAEFIGSSYTTHKFYAYLWDDTNKKVVRRTATRASESISGYPNGIVCYDSSGHIFIRDDMIEHDGDAVNKKYVDTALGDVSTALAAILGV